MGKLITAFTCLLALFFGALWLLYDKDLKQTENAFASAGIFDTWTAPNGDTVVMIAGQKRMIDKNLVSACAYGAKETLEMGSSLLPCFVTVGGEYVYGVLSELSEIWDAATE